MSLGEFMEAHQKLNHLEKEIELFYSYFPITLPGYNEFIDKLRSFYEKAKDIVKNKNQFMSNFHSEFNSVYFGLLTTIRKFVTSFLANNVQAVNQFDNLYENFNKNVIQGNFQVALEKYVDAKRFFYLDITAHLREKKEIWNTLPTEIKNVILFQLEKRVNIHEVNKILRIDKEFHRFFVDTQTYKTKKAQQIPNKNIEQWKEFVILLKQRNNAALEKLEQSAQADANRYGISRYELIEIMFQALDNISQIKQASSFRNLAVKMQEIYHKLEVFFDAKTKNEQIICHTTFKKSESIESMFQALDNIGRINEAGSFRNLPVEMQETYQKLEVFFKAIITKNHRLELDTTFKKFDFENYDIVSNVTSKFYPSGIINKNDILTALQVFIFKLAEVLANKADIKAIYSIRDNISFYFDNIINIFPILIKTSNQKDCYKLIKIELMCSVLEIIQHLNKDKVEHNTRRCLVM